MKIGILTFHSQLNYGGVLQCWALKTALEGMGHEVVVDRWHFPDNRMMRQEFATLTFKGWVKLLIRGFSAAEMSCVQGRWRGSRSADSMVAEKW